MAVSRLARRWATARPYGWVASSAAEWATARVAPTGCNMGCGGRRAEGSPPYGGLQEVRRKNPPVTASPCPFRQGGLGTGDADCHTSDIGHWFAMTGGFLQGVRWAGRRGYAGGGLPLDFRAKKYPLQKRDQSYHTTAAVTMQEKILSEGKFCHIL